MSKTNPNPVDKHIGARVRMRRMMLGVSQEKLAEALGLTFQQVQKYEKGVNRIGGSRMQQIAAALEVPPAYFFEGLPKTGIDAGPDFTADFLSDADGLAVAEAFVKLDSGKRRQIRNIVQSIAEAIAPAA
jgi:transcriptional regulator with XRE-family HTH domain